MREEKIAKTILPAGMRPQSVRGHAYRGINALVLGLSGYSDPRWLTYRKALELEGHVRKGEKSSPVALWKPVEREDDVVENRAAAALGEFLDHLEIGRRITRRLGDLNEPLSLFAEYVCERERVVVAHRISHHRRAVVQRR